MNIFNLIATLTLNDKTYKKGIEDAKKANNKLQENTDKNSKKNVKKWLAQATAIIAVVGATYKLISSTISMGDTIGKESQKLNMTTDAYQKWSLALQMAGTDISTMSMGMKSLTDIISEANNGSADSIILFDKLGLKFEDLKGMTPEEQLYEVVNAFQGMEQGADKTRLAIDFFGKSGQELLPILNQEQGSLEDTFKSFEDLGLIISEEAIKKNEELDDKLTLTNAKFKNMSYNIGEVLMPIFEDIVDAFVFFIDEIKKGNPVLITLGVILGVIAVALLAINAPIVLIIAGVALLIAGIWELYKNWNKIWDGIRDITYNVLNGITKGFETVVNGIIKGLNLLIKAANVIPGVDIKLIKEVDFSIPRFKQGARFIPKDNYLAQLDYGERVLTRSENEEYTALGGVKGIQALVNGISQPTNTNNNIEVKIEIGDKEIKDFIFETVNNQLKKKGYKDLTKVGGY